MEVKCILLNGRLERNIAAYYPNPDNPNEKVWIIPNTVPELKSAFVDTVNYLSNKRVRQELESRDWLDYGDVLESALDTNDPDNAEAKAIQAWYKAYYTEIDKVIATINGKRSIDTLLALDVRQLEEQAFQNAITTSPLP